VHIVESTKKTIKHSTAELVDLISELAGDPAKVARLERIRRDLELALLRLRGERPRFSRMIQDATDIPSHTGPARDSVQDATTEAVRR
jgi:hypothetical protein